MTKELIKSLAFPQSLLHLHWKSIPGIDSWVTTHVQSSYCFPHSSRNPTKSSMVMSASAVPESRNISRSVFAPKELLWSGTWHRCRTEHVLSARKGARDSDNGLLTAGVGTQLRPATSPVPNTQSWVLTCPSVKQVCSSNPIQSFYYWCPSIYFPPAYPVVSAT